MKNKRIIINLFVISVLVLALIIQFISTYQSLISEIDRKKDFTIKLLEVNINDSIHQMDLAADYFLDHYSSKDVKKVSLHDIDDETYYVDVTNIQVQTNISGLKTSSVNQNDLLKELGASIELNKAFKKIYDNSDDIKWVYYMSDNRFLNIYPFVDYSEYTVNQDSFNYDFYKMIKPENNPDRLIKWSNIYADQVTGESMITIGLPIYHGTQFLGSIDIDYTTESISKILKGREEESINYYIINDNNEVIGATSWENSPFDNPLYLKEIIDAQETNMTHKNINNKMISVDDVGQFPIKLVSVVELQKIYLKVVSKLLPVIIFLIGGLVIFNLYYRITVTYDRLEKNQNKFKAVFDETNQMFLIVDSELKITDVNRFFLGFFKVKKKDLIGRDFFEIDIFKKQSILRSFLKESLDDGDLTSLKQETFTIRDNEGNEHDIKFAIIPIENPSFKRTQYILSGVDVTEQVRLQKRLEVLSKTDALTQTYNRRGMYEIVEQAKRRYEEFYEPFSIVICDIDHFKYVNDAFGHECGDEVLVNLVRYMKLLVREFDHVGRWGGEEFLIILSNTTENEAVEIADRIRSMIAQKPFMCQSTENPVYINITLGVSVYDAKYDVKENLAKADQALYYGKNNGRNQVVRYSQISQEREHHDS